MPLPADLTHPVHDEGGDSDDRHREDHVSGDGEPVRDALPRTADPVADQRDHGHPDRRADEAEDAEEKRRHLAEASHDGHEGPHHRQRTADRDRPYAPPGEEALRPVDVRLGDQQVTAEPVHERPLAHPPYAIGNKRADKFGDRSHHDHQDDVEVSLAGQYPREPEGDLGGNRDAARLKEPEQEDGGVTPLGEKTLHRSLLYSMIAGALAAGRPA